MAKFTVFYLMTNEKQRQEINACGWNCKPGLAYLNAREKLELLPALELGMYHQAAVIEVEGQQLDPEYVWRALQNLKEPWTVLEEKGILKRYTNFPRSCDIGDVLYDHDDDCWAIVDKVGFESLTDETIIDKFNELRK